MSLAAALLFSACSEPHAEGYLPGQCEDEADNDADGLFDCQDPDCHGAPACQPEPPLDACEEFTEGDPAALSCLVVADVSVRPAQVEPGESYTVSVWIPHGEANNALLSVAGTAASPALQLQPQDGGFSGEVTLVAAAPLGDQLISLQASHSAGEIAGYTLLYISELGPCPETQVREAGVCVDTAPGPLLLPSSLFFTPYSDQITNLDPEGGDDETDPNAGRMMLHPRRVFQVEQALVACLTDSVAVIDPALMFPISSDEQGGGPQPPPIMERAEGLLDPDGLALCDDLALDSERGIAVATTRGALGQPAGLTSWQLPDLSTPPFADPVLLHTYVDSAGFESAVYSEGYLYATHKPDSLAVFEVGDGGEFTLLSETPLPGSTSSWAVIRDGNFLYVSDAGVHPEREAGQPTGGTLYVLELTDPSAPQLRGSVATIGLGKSLASSGEGRVALAGGETGVEIFDVSEPITPQRTLHVDTPGSAISLAWSGNYLLLSDWNSMRVYDTAESGVLRLLSATDIALSQLGSPPPEPQWAIDNSGFTALSGTDFIITEMDSIFLGSIQPGRIAPSLNLVDRRWSVSATTDDQERDFVVRFRNGGRLPLDVTLADNDSLEPSGQRYLVAPGSTEAVEVQASNLLDDPELNAIVLDSNDPLSNQRRAALVVLEGGLAVADPIPQFRVPMTNVCEGASCSQVSQCFHLDDAQWQGMPILLAFYTSW